MILERRGAPRSGGSERYADKDKRNAEGDSGEGAGTSDGLFARRVRVRRLRRISGRGARLSGSVRQGLGQFAGVWSTLQKACLQ